MTEYVEWLTGAHDNFVIEWRRPIGEQPNCPSKLARISLQPGGAGSAARH
jgi:hypothetical protein